MGQRGLLRICADTHMLRALCMYGMLRAHDISHRLVTISNNLSPAWVDTSFGSVILSENQCGLF